MTSKEKLYLGGAVVLGAYLLFNKSGALNPFNKSNVINEQFNETYSEVTGSPNSFGTDKYNETHDADGNPTTIGTAIVDYFILPDHLQGNYFSTLFN